MSATSSDATGVANRSADTTIELEEKILNKISEKNAASYSDQAKLRYLASNFKGFVFENSEGLLDVAFQHDRTDHDQDGRVTRAQVHTYKDDDFIAKVSTLRDTRGEKYLGIYGASEVFETVEEAREWIKNRGIELDELVSFNIDNHRGGSDEE